jgi:hypothetical protein
LLHPPAIIARAKEAEDYHAIGLVPGPLLTIGCVALHKPQSDFDDGGSTSAGIA